MSPTPDDADVLRRGELRPLGRIRAASNATFLCEAALGGALVHCVYKPIAGEQPLWDFPDGTLAGREVAAGLVAAALGWPIVPETILRDGPAGPGMVQRWIHRRGDGLSDADSPDGPDDADGPDGPDLVDVVPAGAVPPGYLPVLQARDGAGRPVTLVHADDPRLRRIAVFDVLVNNADRKGGHVLAGADGAVYGVDHGLTLHRDDKLRTVLWGWAGRGIDETEAAAVRRLSAALAGPLAGELAVHISTAEIAALGARVAALLAHPVLPGPSGPRPIPWPAF